MAVTGEGEALFKTRPNHPKYEASKHQQSLGICLHLPLVKKLGFAKCQKDFSSCFYVLIKKLQKYKSDNEKYIIFIPKVNVFWTGYVFRRTQSNRHRYKVPVQNRGSCPQRASPDWIRCRWANIPVRRMLKAMDKFHTGRTLPTVTYFLQRKGFSDFQHCSVASQLAPLKDPKCDSHEWA